MGAWQRLRAPRIGALGARAESVARRIALVPVKGADLVTLLVQLSADPDPAVANSAKETLTGVPEGVVLGACSAPLHPAILDGLVRQFTGRDDALSKLAQNSALADETLVHLARTGSEGVTEIIAVNQQRLLGVPKVIEALYHNRNTRMSTADRLVELAARNDVTLTGVKSFQEHVEAIKGELLSEPSEDPLPSDDGFKEALEADSDDLEAIERDKADDSETLKDKFKPLRFRIANMSTSEKVRLAEVGNAAARAILVREPRRLVAMAAVRNMNEAEAAQAAASKEVAVDVLRFIGFKKEWLSHYEVKRTLVFNPRTPTGIALRFIQHLREHDLKTLARSRNVPMPVKTAANQRYQQKQRGRRG